MSLNKLVGGDCGGNNPLVQFSSIVSRDLPRMEPTEADRFVNEFMVQNSKVPNTFNMNALLNNIPEVTTLSQNRQIGSEPFKIAPGPSSAWPSGPTISYMPPLTIMQPYKMYSASPVPQNVQIEYVNESEIYTKAQDSVQLKAQEFVNKVDHHENAEYSQFMSFMKKISAGEMNFNEPSREKRASKDEIFNEMAEKYKDEWAKLSNVNDIWESEITYGIPKEYSFTEGNIMLENMSALEIGKEKLKMGDIPGAALCFEAAVQQQPESAEAWFLLGTTQAENEQDPLAIVALKKSLEIDPTQLEAYITLAAAYTNENLPKYAYLILHNWLKASPKYSDLIPQDIEVQKLHVKELGAHVTSLYLKAAQLNPQVDPDVQNALGVIFNISQEYDKAVDCFKTALMVAPNNAKLWNRVGATLANSDRSEEAVEAYHEALNLEPGFIRTRYNVGITCMNLGAHRQAAEHFLVALNQQHKAMSLHPTSSSLDTTSSTIWSTLRMVCSFMGEHDIAKLVDERKLNELNAFFEIE
ncbi:Peroxisomal targeting signal 1 receptor [Eumeta japonica]|uniref:Peroxisomal targeting signal 1 receptor n=1 Tax=Eumeta variegata TaxID=151549 RepID=A0A4C1SKQ4_EUMVA|nr:Peroxisomal targeting signal 1 receptor [Eumeta japonica]